MNGSTNDIESHIDLFLEHVKRSAARAMEDRGNDGWLTNENLVHSIIKRSRSGMSSSDDGTVQLTVFNDQLEKRKKQSTSTFYFLSTSWCSQHPFAGTESRKDGVRQIKLIETHPWQGYEGNFHPAEPVIWQIEPPYPYAKEFVPGTEAVIQHIPVAFVPPDNPNLAFVDGRMIAAPVTYVLNRDVFAEIPKPPFVIEGPELKEPPKVVFVEMNGQNVFDQIENRVYTAPSEVESFEQPALGTKVDQTTSTIDNSLIDESEDNLTKCANSEEVEESPVAEAEIGSKSLGSDKSLIESQSSTIKSIPKLVQKTSEEELVNVDEETREGIEEEEVREEKVRRRNPFELTVLEDNVEQVMERFKLGCECTDMNCFDGLNAENVFQHRLNIADLTKAEHDMYLMGVIMASLQNVEETCRHKERVRIRSSYAYEGKRVCLTAFLYLQHVTLYQMKSLRSHLKSHGVTPRIHGNRGRKPVNKFSMDIFRRAKKFVQHYVEKNCVKTVSTLTGPSDKTVESDSVSKPKRKSYKPKIPKQMPSYDLPPELTKKVVHKEYKTFCHNVKPGQKVMKYSTFTSFLKKQFPNVTFLKPEPKRSEENQKSEEVPCEDKCIQTIEDDPNKSVQSLEAPVSGQHQVVLNGQHLQFCSSELNGVQPGFAIPNQFLIGNQIYSAPPPQHVFTVDGVV